ncbi:MAG TPA: type II toxin-antitoxin system RelE/ParE family toxin [Verrucomicrobiae bacterium]|nr:type II toxin-antitoxin system RelE/ParE family toxin [Verrucomicrobiae bacterium]
MAEVRWTLQAADDLEAITDFIAQDSPHYASLFAIDVFAAVERLEKFPESGRVVPEKNDPNVREIILGNYRIVYRLRKDMMELLTIHHGAKLLDPARLA